MTFHKSSYNIDLFYIYGICVNKTLSFNLKFYEFYFLIVINSL